jgi:hypothetical protein
MRPRHRRMDGWGSGTCAEGWARRPYTALGCVCWLGFRFQQRSCALARIYLPERREEWPRIPVEDAFPAGWGVSEAYARICCRRFGEAASLVAGQCHMAGPHSSAEHVTSVRTVTMIRGRTCGYGSARQFERSQVTGYQATAEGSVCVIGQMSRSLFLACKQ